MTETRPTGEQLRFVSSATGEHILDTYLEAAEKGGRTLPDLLSDLFSNSGQFNASLFQFRVNSSTQLLEVRVGTFIDPNAGWSSANASIFRWRGAHANATAYERLDLVTYNGTAYFANAAHTSSGAAPNSNFSQLVSIDMSPYALKSGDTLTNPTIAGAATINAAMNLAQIDISLAANQNDYSPTGFETASILRLTPTADRTITGLAAGQYLTSRSALSLEGRATNQPLISRTTPSSGRVIFLFNASTTYSVTLSDASVSSAAANRFDFGYTRVIPPRRGVILNYDATSQRWRDVTYLASATASNVFTGTSTEVFVSPSSIFAAAAPVSVSYAATVTLDFATGFNFDIAALTGNLTLANPTNIKAGQSGRIRIPQDATGNRTITYGSYWKAPGGSASQGLSTAASAVDCVYYYARSTTEIEFTVSRNFS